MAKKKLKRTPEEIARTEEVMRKVQERIDYHTRKLAEERAARRAAAVHLAGEQAPQHVREDPAVAEVLSLARACRAAGAP